MVDLAEQLRRYGEAVEQQAISSPAVAVPRHARRPGGRVLALAAGCALVVSSVAIWTAAESGPSEEIRTTEPPEPDAAETGPSEEVDTADPPGSVELGPGTPAIVEQSVDGFTLYGATPLSPREDVAVVAAGDLVVVWGGGIEGSNVGRPELGSGTYRDGAFLDLRTQEWHPMAPSPLPAGQPLSVGVWTGEVVMLFRGAHAAAWDPSSNTWAALPSPPGPVTRAFWTGEVVIAMGANATYRAGDTKWEALPPGGITPTTLLNGGAAVAAAWTGDELVTVNKSASGRVDVAAYDPGTRRWRTFPGHDLDVGSTSVGVTWTGEELIVMGNLNTVVALDLQTEQWRELPPLPLPGPPQEGVSLLSAVNGTVIVHRAPALGILAGGSWTMLTDNPLPFGQPNPGADGTLLYFGFTNLGFTNDSESSVLGIMEPRRITE